MQKDLKSESLRKIDSLNEMGTNRIVELIKKYGFLSEENPFLIYDYPAFENGNLQNFIYSIKPNSVEDIFLVNKMAKFLLKYRDYHYENLDLQDLE